MTTFGFSHGKRSTFIFVFFVYSAFEGAVLLPKNPTWGFGRYNTSILSLQDHSCCAYVCFSEITRHCNIKKLFIFFSAPYEVTQKNIEWTSRVIFLEMFMLSEVKVRLPHGRN